ncbi:hypothetical protein HanPI659440_Chr05g0202221 [Helianthus annuus]|nr:hypothetical protein HanPI659440_Chr05g0202221 [Helianthus annuus]
MVLNYMKLDEIWIGTGPFGWTARSAGLLDRVGRSIEWAVRSVGPADRLGRSIDWAAQSASLSSCFRRFSHVLRWFWSRRCRDVLNN